MTSDITEKVIATIKQVINQNGLDDSPIQRETNILNDTSLDSLALAEVIVMLEMATGKDPFAEGFINFRTVGELAQLYEK